MKVFLSSTYLDLVEHRKAVVQTLCTMDVGVGHMEIFGARDEEAVIASLEELDNCDVLVGVYAYRYGTVPKGSKISVTEEEYLHATSKKIPILVFVVNETYDWPSIKDESLAKIEKLKSRATREHTPAYFSTPDNLAAQVVASIGRLEKKKSISGPSESIQRQFDKAEQLFANADYEAAAKLYQEIAGLANNVHDSERERKALHMAVRALDTYFVLSHLDEWEREGVLKQINDHLQVLESLAIDSDMLGVDKARLALLSKKPQEALQIAGEVLARASVGSVHWVDALLTCIQAYWQLEKIDDALGMKDLIRRGLSKKVESHARISLAATWLRTQIRAGKVTRRNILRFSKLVRELKDSENIGAKKAMMIVGEVAVESNQKALHAHTLALLELAFELGEEVAEPAMASSAALQVAEVAIYANEISKVNVFLGKANEWVEEAKLPKYRREDSPNLWENLHANWLAGKGRILVTTVERSLIVGEEAEESLIQALTTLEEGRQFAVENRTLLQGNVDLFLAELNYWSGFAAFNLNWHDKAVECFRAVRSESAMAHPRFSAEMGMRAWLTEAEALALSGQTNKAIEVVGGLLQDERSRVNPQIRAEEFRDYLQNRINPVIQWFNSSEAKAISHLAKTISLRDAIKEQMLPLISWWTKWSKEYGESDALSGFFDFWGRGGFSRVAAAIRAKPHQVIAVDAISIDDIRKWTRIFCPLFDTVLVKWKGALGSGIVLTPMDVKYGGPGSFGGHGYLALAGTSIGENFCPAMAWVNPLPVEVSVFLATEALPLLQSGRLVVLPAPLVGCTQTAVGWTDNLLLDGFLGGVVDTALKRPVSNNVEHKNRQRVLDLSKISIPYIDNISSDDLVHALEDTEEFVPHLRTLLLNSILSENIRYEQWEAIGVLENEIRDACRELEIRLCSLSSRGQWHLAKADGVFSVASHSENRIGQEPISNLLSSLVERQDQLAPWVPYWRMKSLGGYLDWSHPIDNPSKPPQQRPDMHKEIHSWLYPGTGGWQIPLVGVPSER